MTPYWWTCTLLLTFLAVGPSQRTVFADDLQELSRSVCWRHLALQETPPDDLTVDVPHNVSTLRYAEWVYALRVHLELPLRLPRRVMAVLFSMQTEIALVEFVNVTLWKVRANCECCHWRLSRLSAML